MRIGPHEIGSGRPFVVAEVGNNHEGRFDVAERLVREAAACGADAVKFQTFDADRFVRRADEARWKRLRSFQLTHAQFRALAELARSLDLVFFSTPLDLPSAEFLDEIAACFKIASGDNDFYPLIARAVRSGKPVIVSTGASDLAQVERVVAFVQREAGAAGLPVQLAVLHCVSAYPAAPAQVNLRAIPFLAARLDCPVGYSDHTVGIEAAVLAAALGAAIVEKHFTLDHAFSDFRDHQLSADPAEMRQLVERVRGAAVLLGRAAKEIQPDEQAMLQPIRRSIVAGRDLPAGHRLAREDLLWIRPAGGLPPGEEARLVGRALRRAVAFQEQLRPEDVE